MTDPERELLRWLCGEDRPGVALLACAHVDLLRVPVDSVGVHLAGCVRHVDIGLPAQLLACGLDEVRVIVCPRHTAEVTELVSTWSDVLPDVSLTLTPKSRRGSGPVFDLGDGTSDRQPRVSRRGLLGLSSNLHPPFDLSADATGRGVAALEILRQQRRAQIPSPTHKQPHVAPVAVRLTASGCVACGVCVRACPHDALTLTEVGDVVVLSHQTSACRGERECLRLCPESALEIAADLALLELVDAEESEQLARVETRTCVRCSARHPAGEGDLCPTCTYRRKNPFGSVVRQLPPVPDARKRPGANRREPGCT